VGYRVLKIGLPKLRLSRKLLIITLGITVLLGGTSAAALYFKSAELGLASVENTIGGECTDVQVMVLKTPTNRLWLRRFIRMENASGPDRVRTALRIAGLLAKKNAVDLIHVSVLDSHGPTVRSQMRARSIGAEVLIAMKPDNLPEMKSPAMASYYEGPVSDEGRYYGDKVVVDIDEIGAMMTAMRSVEEKPDCVSPEKAEDAEAKPNEHGKKEDHAAKPAEDHGEEPGKEGTDEAAAGDQSAKEQSFFDSMMSMVGLGGSEEKPAEDHPPATDDSHAVAEEPADAASEDHGKKTTSEHEAKPADEADKAAAEHEAKPEDHGNQAETEGHDAAEKPASNHEAVEGTKPAADDHDAAADHTETGDKTDAHDVSAPADEEPAPPPADDDDHAEQKKPKVDQHAEVSMPVGD